MKQMLLVCAALLLVSACGAVPSASTSQRVLASRPVRGGVVAQPGWPCPACVLSLHQGTSDTYDLSGSLDGDYFTEHSVSLLSDATLHLYDDEDEEIANAGASPTSANGAASMSGSIRGTDPAYATLTWTVTYTNQTTDRISQDVPIQ